MRLADVGPAAAGFWRLALAIPFLWLLTRFAGQKPRRHLGRGVAILIIVSAFFYASDLAAWNAGILLTKLGNATLFGNIGSLVFALWGLWIARRLPSAGQAAALALAAFGCVLLMAGSYELSPRHLRGDLLAVLAGLLYAGYLIGVERLRGALPALPLLFLITVASSFFLLPISAAFGEQIWPTNWTPLLIFALSSQVLGQGLLVYSIGVFSPLVVGLALLTQPAISALIGWLAYGETLSPLDWIGAAAIAVAIVLVRLPARGLQPGDERPS